MEGDAAVVLDATTKATRSLIRLSSGRGSMIGKRHRFRIASAHASSASQPVSASEGMPAETEKLPH